VNNIFKGKNLILIFLTGITLVFFLIIVIDISERLMVKASEEVKENNSIYDIFDIMSYYVESISIEDTLINNHYTQQTSDDVEVTCLSCHDIDILRKLYILCDSTTIDEMKTNMTNSSMSICLTCHGTYEDLAALTKDNKETYLVDSLGMSINPHNTMQGEVECSVCHLVHSTTDIYNNALNFCYDCHKTKSFMDLSTG
jgi:hypothetical protein